MGIITMYSVYFLTFVGAEMIFSIFGPACGAPGRSWISLLKFLLPKKYFYTKNGKNWPVVYKKLKMYNCQCTVHHNGRKTFAAGHPTDYFYVYNNSGICIIQWEKIISERFNMNPLLMLGKLKRFKKLNWKCHINSLIHVYNSIIN